MKIRSLLFLATMCLSVICYGNLIDNDVSDALNSFCPFSALKKLFKKRPELKETILFDMLRVDDHYPIENRVEFLLAAGANPNATQNNRSLLHSCLFYQTYPNHQLLAPLLIAHGASVNVRDGEGNTPLHEAAYYNAPLAVIAELLSARAELNAPNDKSETPLAKARYAKN